METEVGKENGYSMYQDAAAPGTRTGRRSLLGAEAALRALAFALALAAICLLVTSRQSITIIGIEFTAHYQDSSALKFLLATETAACALSIMSLISVYVFNRSRSGPKNQFFLFMHDMVVMVLLMAGSAAATAVGYLGQYGQEKSGWVPICDKVGKFCHRVLASVLLSYLAFICYFLLTIFSANSLKHSKSQL